METHSSILGWKIYEQRSLAGYSPCGHKELGMTEHAHMLSDHKFKSTNLRKRAQAIKNPTEKQYIFQNINILSVRNKENPGTCQVALVVKNPPANAGDVRDLGSIPGSGRPPGEGHGNPLQYSCLENPMDREAWQGTVHGVTKSQTQLK